MTDTHADIGPTRTLSETDLARLTSQLRRESALADECMMSGRTYDPDRALNILLKISATLNGLPRKAGHEEPDATT